MKIGIIGSRIVGQDLAKAFSSEGHQVILGARNTLKEEIVDFKNKNPKINIGTFKEAAEFGELIVLAVNGGAAIDAIIISGNDNFNNKTVIDVTNPISTSGIDNGVLNYFTDINFSLMERIQRHIPNAKLVKAFNSVGHEYMYKPDFPGGPPTMFICGNDEGAKKTVTEILSSFGWETADMGKVEAARAIEPLCMLWCIPGMTKGEWNHAFKLLKGKDISNRG